MGTKLLGLCKRSIGDRLHLNSQYYQIKDNIEPTAKVEEVAMQTVNVIASEPKASMAIQENNLQDGLLYQPNVLPRHDVGTVVDLTTKLRANDNYNLANDNYKINDNSQHQLEISKKITVGQQEVTKVKNDLKANSSHSNTPPPTYNSSTNKKYLSELNRKQEMADLKRQLSMRAERVAYSLLGLPNKYLSNNHTLRWGEDGKIVMKITGSKAGIWHDFSNDSGGDLFTLVQREKDCDFIQAKEYLQDMVGMVNNYQNKATWLKDLAADAFYQKVKSQEQKEQDVEKAKIKYAQDLYNKSNSLKYSTPDNVAKKYLSEHRGIEIILTKYQLSQDLRTSMIWDNTTKQHYPVLISFARDKEGKITGGQAIYLNKDTGAKANIDVNKRSFGKISRSFVEIQRDNDQKSNITIIAEGVETALSLQEAGLKGNIFCSLGVSNIKNYHPKANERIIIAADNDGQNAPAIKAVANAKEILEQKGAIVSITMPKEPGDFNDLLKTQGPASIRELLVPEINKLATGHKNNQIKSIELELSKSVGAENSNTLQNFQNAIKSLERFTILENITTALQLYKDQGLETFITHTHKICATAIEQKITIDFQTMHNKFNPNFHLVATRFCDMVIYDFKGKSHTIPEDYLAAIGKDKQVMQYINHESTIGKEIKLEMQNVAEMQRNHRIAVK